MKFSKTLALIFMAAPTLILTLSYAGINRWTAAQACIAVGLLGLAAQHWKWPAITSLAFFFFTVMSAMGIILQLKIIWMLIAVTSALMAWDFEYFTRRMARTKRVDKALDIEWEHIKRTALVAAAGLGLGALAISAELNIKFGWMVLLAVASVYGVTRIVKYMKEEND